MSNPSVFSRLHALIDGCDIASSGNGAFERAIEFHMDALEGIDTTTIHRVRVLTSQLVQAHFLDGDIEFGNSVDAADAKAEFHAFLRGLE
ncbi:hypothetical protein [Pseudobythopirellula maris]|uniref:hypothetical protein n=1 Tax=Pseudobythopirellula maris TaxID=2527991 RepID=UPI0011B646B6|nr:hypothetical protein [Pseudobythopirellula maris]